MEGSLPETRDGLGRLRRLGERGHVHVPEALGAEPFELLVDRARRLGDLGLAAPAHRVGHQYVLGAWHGVLQHPVDTDHVHARQRRSPARRGKHGLAVVGHDLHRQAAGLNAPVAPADPECLQACLLLVERAVHGGGERDQRAGDLLCRRVGDVQEGGVSLQPGQLEVGSGVDDRVEQSLRVLLRVRQARPVHVHEARVAADVGDHEQRVDGLGSHGPMLLRPTGRGGSGRVPVPDTCLAPPCSSVRHC